MHLPRWPLFPRVCGELNSLTDDIFAETFARRFVPLMKKSLFDGNFAVEMILISLDREFANTSYPQDLLFYICKCALNMGCGWLMRLEEKAGISEYYYISIKLVVLIWV